MEIPVQVAVRLCPQGQGAARQAQQRQTHKQQQEKLKEKTTTKSTGNGNTSDKDNKANIKAQESPKAKLNPDQEENDLEEEEDEEKNRICVQCIPLAPRHPGIPPPGCMDPPGLVQVGPHAFPVTHALPLNVSQQQLYHQSVFPLMSLFMEGFDASIVTYGQKGCGKTYSLYGKGFDDPNNEFDMGIVGRCVREIFAHIANHPERTYAVNITWVEIYREIIRDIFGVGSVQCMNMTDVLHWLRTGFNLLYSSKLQLGHSLFSLTLEQRWISKEGLIQHRLSTASFTDLGPTERLFMLNSLEQPTSLPKDLGLQSLENVVSTLADPNLMFKVNGNVPYNQTMLTTLLKDSFGGRAQTLVVCCVSQYERDINETICNLQFAFKAQCVRNFVVINSYSDDNTPVSPEALIPPPIRDLGGTGMPPTIHENFGLQIAAKQWSKLVSNAENLLTKLISSNSLPEAAKEQIQEWLSDKQEYEECFNSTDVLNSIKHLGPIQETEEPNDDEDDDEDDDLHSEADSALQANSDIDSGSESQRPDIEEKVELLMDDLQVKTDVIVNMKYQNFMENHPKGVTDSQEIENTEKQKSEEDEKDKEKEKQNLDEDLKENPKEESDNEQRVLSIKSNVEEIGGNGGGGGGAGGRRRRSLQPGSTLSSAELAMLKRVASREQSESDKSKENLELQRKDKDFLDVSTDLEPLRKHTSSPSDLIHKKIRKLEADIEGRLKQIKEIEETMQLKQNIITELIKNSDTSTTAKQRFHKKRSKLEAEYEKTKKSLAKATAQQRDKGELDRLKAVITHLEQRLNDVTSIKHIAGESVQKVKKLQQSLNESKKQMEDLQKKVKKEKKLKESLQNELKSLKEKENTKALVKMECNSKTADDKSKHLKEVQTRIALLDHVLKEKSDNLEQYRDDEQRESLRHEIRNLRKTRDHLIDQRCTLDRKLKRDKMLSHKEERKLLECDEAIEAIDAAIEFKNELICGHKSIDTSEKLQREKGEQMLMARLNKLTNEEMRTLLYKYFTKVIDLRDSSRKLEMQLVQLEREKDAWEWKERVLSNAVRQARLEGERNAVLLQRQHEMKLTLMLRHLAEESSNSSASFTDQSLAVPRLYKPSHLPLVPASNQSSAYFNDSDFEWTRHTHSQQQHYNNNHNSKYTKACKVNDMEICPLPDPCLTKYKPLDKIKDKEREAKNKLFAKFQVLTRYASSSGSNSNQHNEDSTLPSTSSSNSNSISNSNSNSNSKGKKEKEIMAKQQQQQQQQQDIAAVVANIPQENLKKLNTNAPNTKVTRQKNKIIIQDKSRKN